VNCGQDRGAQRQRHHLAALLADLEILPEQSLRGRCAQAHQHLRLEHFQFGLISCKEANEGFAQGL